MSQFANTKITDVVDAYDNSSWFTLQNQFAH